MKFYNTWNLINVSEVRKTHPNTNNFANDGYEDFIFTETAYHGQINPAIEQYIGMLEYPDTKTIPEINQYNSHIANYQIQEKTEEEINSLLLDWYGVDGEGNQYITVNNYIFTYNRNLD